jgi:prevent-host-death family protein
MKHMQASKFKARCLSVMEDVNATGEPVIITKRGTPVAKVVPVSSKKRDLFGFMAGEFRIVADIEGPMVSIEEWEVMRK